MANDEGGFGGYLRHQLQLDRSGQQRGGPLDWQRYSSSPLARGGDAENACIGCVYVVAPLVGNSVSSLPAAWSAMASVPRSGLALDTSTVAPHLANGQPSPAVTSSPASVPTLL